MIKEILIKFRNAFSEWKIWVARISGYINLANMALILYMLFTDKGVNMRKWGILIFIGVFIFVTTFGWLDTKLGFFRREAQRTADRNPYFEEIREGMKKVNERLEKIENRIH